MPSRSRGSPRNTLVFFCSDNGPEGSGNPPPEYDPYHGVYYGSAGAFKGRKRYLYNGGVCVPAFAWWPGTIGARSVSDQPLCTLDYLPTLAAAIGAEEPTDRPIDGVNILPPPARRGLEAGQDHPFRVRPAEELAEGRRHSRRLQAAHLVRRPEGRRALPVGGGCRRGQECRGGKARGRKPPAQGTHSLARVGAPQFPSAAITPATRSRESSSGPHPSFPLNSPRCAAGRSSGARRTSRAPLVRNSSLPSSQ